MTIDTKLGDPRQVIVLYGTTPPRASASPEQIATAAQRLTERVAPLGLDGLVVYDVQDESSRTSSPRPFPFLPTIAPREYAARLQRQTGVPAICYKCVANVDAAAWGSWLSETREQFGLRYLSLVGLSSTNGGQSAISLSRAIQIAAAHPSSLTLGGVTIAERHSPERSESARILHKTAIGCRYFISQAVYHAETTIGLLRDYAADCQRAGVAPQRVVLTFMPCGRAKTMEFIKWLGVALTPDTEQSILADAAPLSKSIQICRDNLRAILDATAAMQIPLGLNIESVSINRDEIDASIALVYALRAVLAEYQ